MKPDEFEQKLSRQPWRQIPAEWRGEILAAAMGRGSRVGSQAQTGRQPSTLAARLATFFWPHPKAWAGLAAVWVFILAMNFSMRDPSPGRAEKSVPPSPAMMVELKQQQRMFAELVGAYEPMDADRRKIFPPKPRSERGEILMT